MSKQAIDRRVATRRWRVVQPGVYVPRPVPPSWRQRLTAAVLSGGPGALASHRAASALWGLSDVRDEVVEVSIKSGKLIAGAVVHRRRDDPTVAMIEMIPVTGVERTLLDLAAETSLEQAGGALDEVLRRRLTTLVRLREHLESLGRRGRAGSKALRRLMDARDGAVARTESRLESALLQVLRRHGLPVPIPQFRVLDGGLVVARLDFAYPSQRIGIEADGFRWHGSPERWRRDIRRENRLKLLGWTILRFSWQDVHERPEVVASQIRAALESRSVSTEGGASPILRGE